MFESVSDLPKIPKSLIKSPGALLRLKKLSSYDDSPLLRSSNLEIDTSYREQYPEIEQAKSILNSYRIELKIKGEPSDLLCKVLHRICLELTQLPLSYVQYLNFKSMTFYDLKIKPNLLFEPHDELCFLLSELRTECEVSQAFHRACFWKLVEVAPSFVSRWAEGVQHLEQNEHGDNQSLIRELKDIYIKLMRGKNIQASPSKISLVQKLLVEIEPSFSEEWFILLKKERKLLRHVHFIEDQKVFTSY